MEDIPEYQSNYAMQLQLASPNQAVPIPYAVIPLTRDTGLNKTDQERGVRHVWR